MEPNTESTDLADGTREFPVLASIAPVVKRSRRVFLHETALHAAVHGWGHLLQPASAWQHPCHYDDDTAQTVRWIFVLDILNHCFWPEPGAPAWSVTYQQQTYSGYWGLAASLKRAIENRVPLTRADYLARLTAQDLHGVFAGTGQIPLFDDRLHNLREAGRVLLADWRGDVLHLLEAAGGSAVKAVALITAAFPSFRDQTLYHDKTVYFWKRAQIFVADLYLAFNGSRWGYFSDIERLTAFADYKLPQVLRELGILRYAPQLAQRVDRRENLPAQSAEEIEIRALTIWAVEALRRAFSEQGRQVSSLQVDNWLWQLGQLDRFRSKPYHRCRTIFY